MEIQHDKINNLDLRSDIENDNIIGCTLIPQGYVGNRPPNFKGLHEDDTWAIDCFNDEVCVDSYLYSSEHEYQEDLKLIGKYLVE